MNKLFFFKQQIGYSLVKLRSNVKFIKTGSYTPRLIIFVLMCLFAFPLLIILLLLKPLYHKKYSVLKITQHTVKHIMCPKCKTGQLYFAYLFDGYWYPFMSKKTKDFFVCTICTNVYPVEAIKKEKIKFVFCSKMSALF